MMIEHLGKSSKTGKNKAILGIACIGMLFTAFSLSTAPASAEFGGVGSIPQIEDSALYNPLGGFVASIQNTYQNNACYLDTTLPTLYNGANPYFVGGAFLITDYAQRTYDMQAGRLDLVYQTYTPVSHFSLSLQTPTTYVYEDLERTLEGCYVNFNANFEITYNVRAWSWTEERYVELIALNDLGSTFPLDLDNGNNLRQDVLHNVGGVDYILIQSLELNAIPLLGAQTYDVRLVMDIPNDLTYGYYRPLIEAFNPPKIFQGETGLFSFVDDFFNMEIFPNFRLYTIVMIALGLTLFGLIMKLFLGG